MQRLYAKLIYHFLQQQEAEARQREDLPGEIVQRIVADTDVGADAGSRARRSQATPISEV